MINTEYFFISEDHTCVCLQGALDSTFALDIANRDLLCGRKAD
jgi:hypothetical protein